MEVPYKEQDQLSHISHIATITMDKYLLVKTYWIVTWGRSFKMEWQTSAPKFVNDWVQASADKESKEPHWR